MSLKFNDTNKIYLGESEKDLVSSKAFKHYFLLTLSLFIYITFEVFKWYVILIKYNILLAIMH